MRWVDIDKLEEIHPDLNEWEARSNKILNDLRKEIEDAESNANKAGLNVSSERKKAITEGLKKKSRQDIWRELALHLKKLRNSQSNQHSTACPGNGGVLPEN